MRRIPVGGAIQSVFFIHKMNAVRPETGRTALYEIFITVL